MSRRSIAVIGGGAWGTALAVHLGRLDHEVRLWILEPDLVDRMQTRRDNPVYLPGVAVPDRVQPVGDPREATREADLVLAVVPSQFARPIYRRIADALADDTALLVATKGIEGPTLSLPLEVAVEELGEKRPMAVLSGPSFAAELAAGRPTAVVVASESDDLTARIQTTLASACLRLYSSPDPIGVQVAGALKNVIAIAAGVADALEMGANAQAALITRGLAEISRLGQALGGRPATFAGLAGMGDLVLTCTGLQSRNRRVGQRLGRGERLADILASARTVAEGVETTRSACALARRAGVEMPIAEELHRVLFEDGSPQEGLARLMARPPTSEEPARGDCPA